MKYYLHDIQDSINCYKSALEKLNHRVERNPEWRYFFAQQQYAASWYIVKQCVEALVQSNRRNDALRLIYTSRLKMLMSNTDVQALMVYIEILEESFDVAEKKCLDMLKKKLSVDARTEFSFFLALAQAGQGKLEDSLVSIRQTLALHSEKLEAWSLLGSVHMLRQEWQGAIEAFQKLISRDYFDFRSWEHLGLCYVKLGDMSSAKHSYEQAVHLNPSEANIWIDLAGVYMQLGESDLARSAYQNGLRYDWLDNVKRQQALESIHSMK